MLMPLILTMQFRLFMLNQFLTVIERSEALMRTSELLEYAIPAADPPRNQTSVLQMLIAIAIAEEIQGYKSIALVPEPCGGPPWAKCPT